MEPPPRESLTRFWRFASIMGEGGEKLKTIAVLAVAIIVFVSGFVSGLSSSDRFKFRSGDAIELKNRRIYGYGVRPRGTILGFKQNADGKEYYMVEMERDVQGNFLEWMKTGKFENAGRDHKIETHFKQNIERHFIKAAY